MKRLAINVRGTSGSGKTTLARELMRRTEAKPITEGGRRPIGYSGFLPQSGQCIWFVGSYENPCGGCDTIKSMFEVCGRVLHFAGQGGHLFYEGLMVSTTLHRFLVLDKELEDGYGMRTLWGFLDTPLDLCLRRIDARRLAKGNLASLDPDGTMGRHRAIQRIEQKVWALGRWVMHLNHLTAADDLLELLEKSV